MTASDTTPTAASAGEPVWSDWPRKSHDRRYEIGLREDQDANQLCPFCENHIDQTCEVVIIGDNGSLAICHAACLPEECEAALQPHPSQQAGTEGVDADAKPVGDAGREAIWKVVHEVWQMLDDAETDSAGVTTPDQQRWQAVSEAMDALEALVPDSEGPFWGGYPVNYLWPRGVK